MKRPKKPAAPRRIAATPAPDLATPTAERTRQGRLEQAQTYEFDPGDRSERITARPLRDLNASAAKRLARCPGLTSSQIVAGGLFERDHEVGRLEPRMTANLSAAGGGGRAGADEMPLKVLEARDRKHAALEALRAGGAEVRSVVEAVVLNGVTVTETGQSRYANRSAAKAWVSLALTVGLSLLEGHYRTVGRMAG
jgi:hypothetical protein